MRILTMQSPKKINILPIVQWMKKHPGRVYIEPAFIIITRQFSRKEKSMLGLPHPLYAVRVPSGNCTNLNT